MPGESKDNPVELPSFEPELELVTGILFDNPRSFRGKVYNGLIESIANVSLYQEEITNAKVREIAEYLDIWVPEEHLGELDELLGFSENASVNLKHYNDLKRSFRAFADAGASLCGWW